LLALERHPIRRNLTLFGFGKADGRAWAESGRSIAAIEAVYNLCTRDEDCSGDLEAELMDKMIAEIGDDDEFDAIDDEDAAYSDAWFDGVCEVFGEMP
jgi:hypothetical protein